MKIKIWNIYANFKTPCGFSSWQKITLKADTFDNTCKLLGDLKRSFGLELSINK